MRLVSRDITWLLIELIGGVPEAKGNNESWSGVFEVEAGADEKQQIKFVWPNGRNKKTKIKVQLK